MVRYARIGLNAMVLCHQFRKKKLLLIPPQKKKEKKYISACKIRLEKKNGVGGFRLLLEKESIKKKKSALSLGKVY
jgi:hypothetical protein